MVSIELDEEEIRMFWTVMINQICQEYTAMQNAKTAKDLLTHKDRKEICDGMVKKIKEYI